MSRKRLGRLQRAATIVPLALLSAAWTASVAGIGGASAPVAADEEGTLPDGTSVPAEAIEAPASLSDPDDLGDHGNAAGIINAASTDEIPAAALAAYQRAETVINSADRSCNLTWQLIAAIGRVESNHGRIDGNVLDDGGVADPGIYGVPLDGRRSTRTISDTDAGQIDNDTRWDRAVGPMQFIPSTWSVVGVDADSDDERNPQDVDDAALATAVYLCSGKDDLSEVTGQRAAVFRYNHSQRYVDLVLAVMAAYLEGDFTTVPNNTTAADYPGPEGDYYYRGGSTPGGDDDGGELGGDELGGDDTGENGDNGGDDSGEDNGGDDTAPPTDDPGGDDNGGDRNDSPTDPDNDNAPDTGTDVDEPAEDLVDGVLGLLDPALVKVTCAAKWPPLLDATKYEACVKSYGQTP